jgi:hypothetical protein
MTLHPSNLKLYDQVKKQADAKFLAPTSVYKSAWIIREYKKRNGTFTDPKPKDKSTGLKRWFLEKWVDLNRPGEACGRKSSDLKTKYPLCRPTIKVTKNTPRLAQNIDAKTIKSANKEKQRIRETGHISFMKK